MFRYHFPNVDCGLFFYRTEANSGSTLSKFLTKRLLDEGFVFEFNEAIEALNNLCWKEATKSSSSILSH
jgi:hypothetical protein